ncbi:MAG TPA: response regulator [Terriglobales bacterium]|nr:response regulator [Terriglobales bacterium]
MALKILLADDSMTAQNMGKKILTEAGYEVIAVSNGAAAVKKIAEQKPDVVVLDVYMPGYTGLEVCERVKSAIETTKIPVLLTVGKMEPFKPEEGARVKADGVIVKPFEASDLLAAVQKLEQRLNSSNPKAKVMVTPAQPPSDELPDYERTQKIKTPVFDEKDASYQKWKSATDEHSALEPAQTPAPALPRIELPEEDFPSAVAEEPHAVNVPTEMRASPAMGMEHLDSDLPADQTTTEILERNTAYLERSTAEVDPYQIMEEGGAGSPQSGVGRFFSKAKSWFGGASALEGYEETAGGAAAPADEAETETVRLSPAQLEEALQSVASHPSTPHAAEAPPVQDMEHHDMLHEHAATSPSQAEGSAHDLHMESADVKVESVPHAEVSDLHLSSVSTSWEPVPSPAAEASPTVHEPELEVISSSEAHVPSGTASDLEITSPRSSGDVPAGASADSLLVTDVSEMSAQFPTRFGVEGAEPVPVGNAADYPELYGHTAGTMEEHAATPSIEDTQEIDAPELREVPATHDQPEDLATQVAAAMGQGWAEKANADGSHEPHEASVSGWSAEETHLEQNEIGVSLHEEMHQQISGSGAGTGQASATAAPAASENGPDVQLAAAMAAAMGTEVTPAMTEAVQQAFTGDSTMALDKNTAVIAEIVHRVTERMKPELVAEIARELASEIKKKKE